MSDPLGSLEPPAGVRALLFDCDGTLVDTMGLYRAVWTDIFVEHGFNLTEQWWHETGAIPLKPFVRAALPQASDALIAELREQSVAAFNDRLHSLEPMEHVIEVVRRFHGVLPMAVCSGSFRESVVGSLDAVGITHLFDHVLSADDVVNSKPAPDLYVLGMDRLGVKPNEVVVYEDSAIGMSSARAAGIVHIIDVRFA